MIWYSKSYTFYYLSTHLHALCGRKFVCQCSFASGNLPVLICQVIFSAGGVVIAVNLSMMSMSTHHTMVVKSFIQMNTWLPVKVEVLFSWNVLKTNTIRKCCPYILWAWPNRIAGKTFAAAAFSLLFKL